MLPTATGIESSVYSSLGNGATLSSITVYSIDTTLEAAVDNSLITAGYTGDPIAMGSPV